jgi:hypothetical protein
VAASPAPTIVTTPVATSTPLVVPGRLRPLTVPPAAPPSASAAPAAAPRPDRFDHQ